MNNASCQVKKQQLIRMYGAIRTPLALLLLEMWKDNDTQVQSSNLNFRAYAMFANRANQEKKKKEATEKMKAHLSILLFNNKTREDEEIALFLQVCCQNKK